MSPNFEFGYSQSRFMRLAYCKSRRCTLSKVMSQPAKLTARQEEVLAFCSKEVDSDRRVLLQLSKKPQNTFDLRARILLPAASSPNREEGIRAPSSRAFARALVLVRAERIRLPSDFGPCAFGRPHSCRERHPHGTGRSRNAAHVCPGASVSWNSNSTLFVCAWPQHEGRWHLSLETLPFLTRRPKRKMGLSPPC